MLPLLLLTCSLIPLALCYTPLKRQDGEQQAFQSGPEEPADPATNGYFINHFSLNTNNLTRTIDFYNKVFGMRHMFTYHITEHLSVSYIGHSQGGRNGSAFQTTEEMIRNKQNSAGLIQVTYFNTTSIGGEPIPGPNQRTSTLCNIGFVVPDSEATQRRLEQYGVTIYKKLGEQMPDDGPLGNPFSIGDATNLSPEAWKAIQDQMTTLNQYNIFAADPDGNLLEILPLNEPNVFG